MKIKTMKIISIIALVMLISVLGTFVISASSTGGQEDTSIPAPVIPEFEFFGYPCATLDEMGFPYDELRSAFPDVIEVKYENGKYMLKDVGAYTTDGYVSGMDTGVELSFTLVDGWWICELDETIYNDENAYVIVYFYGENNSWSITYVNGEVSGSLVINCNEDQSKSVYIYYYDYSCVEFFYYVGDRRVRDIYLDGMLNGQEVNRYINDIDICIQFDAECNVISISAYTQNDEWLYYGFERGWYKYVDGEEVACEGPEGMENADAEYFATVVPTGINCAHENYSDATCTEPKACTVCGKTEGELADHSFTEATCTEPKTCTVCGETEGELADHSFTDATCTEPKTCTVCGETEGELADHSFTEATCTEPKTCTVCGETEGELADHSFTEATCTEPQTCTVCGETEGELADHSFGSDGTCTVCSVNSENVITILMNDSYGDGWNGNAIEIYEDGVFVRAVTFANGSAATVECYYFPDREYEFYWVSGNYADECSFEIVFGTETVFVATEDDCASYFTGYRFYPECQHVYGEGTVIEPACTTEGYTIYTCTLCDLTKKDNYVDSLGGHTKNEEPGVITEPTCENLGYTTYVCAVCDESFDSDYVNPFGHKKDAQTGMLSEPDCENEGYTTYECTECGEFFNDDHKAALGHTLGDDGNCTVCGEKFTVPVWLGDVQISVDNMDDIIGDGTASYDAQTNTLTLNGFNFESDYEIDALYSEIALNIILKGQNTIVSGGWGFYFDIFDGTVTIGGDGSLTLITSYESIYFDIGNHASLIIGGDVSIDFQPDNNDPICFHSETGSADLIIKDNAELIMGTEDNPISEECIYIYCFEGATVTIQDNAKLYGETTDEEGIYASSDEGSSSVTISDNATVYLICDEEGIYAGTVTITGGTVTVIGGEEYEGIDAEKIIISGGTVDSHGDKSGIYGDNITITGGTVNASATGENGCGILAMEMLTISGGTVTACGTDDGIYVYGELIITAGTLNVTGGVWVDKYDEENEVYIPGTITIGENMHISAPEGGSVSTVTNGEYTYAGIINSDGTEADSLVISHKHNWQEATCISLKKCTVCGTEDGGFAECIPNTDDGDCTTEVVCTVCGRVTTPNKEAHVDNDNNGKCDVCEHVMPGTSSNPNEGNTHEGNTNDDGGLGMGSIIGIAAGTTAAVGIGGFSLFWFVIKKKKWSDLVGIFKK